MILPKGNLLLIVDRQHGNVQCLLVLIKTHIYYVFMIKKTFRYYILGFGLLIVCVLMLASNIVSVRRVRSFSVLQSLRTSALATV